MPLFVRELGVTDPGRIALWSGLIAAVTPAVSGLLGPFFGRLADRFGRKLMLIRSLAAFTLIIAIMGLVRTVEELFAARLVQGLFAGFTPMAMAVASVSAPRDRVPGALALVQSAQLASVAIGPALGGYVADHFGIRYAFFATAGLCGVALIGLIGLFQELTPAGADGARAPTPRLPMRAALRYPNFLLVLGLLFVAQFLDRGLALLVPLQVAHLPGLEAAAAAAGAIISVAAIAATLSANVAARLTRGLPASKLVMVGLLVGGPLCAAMALARGWPSILVLRTLVALCLGGVITLAYALGAEIVPAEQRGAAFGWLALGVQIGTAASPLVSGGVASISLEAAYVVEGALACLAGAVVAFCWRAKPSSPR
jgi:DHA1 family multidrug resistance protein-like MFS transporter